MVMVVVDVVPTVKVTMMWCGCVQRRSGGEEKLIYKAGRDTGW